MWRAIRMHFSAVQRSEHTCRQTQIFRILESSPTPPASRKPNTYLQSIQAKRIVERREPRVRTLYVVAAVGHLPVGSHVKHLWDSSAQVAEGDRTPQQQRQCRHEIDLLDGTVPHGLLRVIA